MGIRSSFGATTCVYLLAIAKNIGSTSSGREIMPVSELDISICGSTGAISLPFTVKET